MTVGNSNDVPGSPARAVTFLLTTLALSSSGCAAGDPADTPEPSFTGEAVSLGNMETGESSTATDSAGTDSNSSATDTTTTGPLLDMGDGGGPTEAAGMIWIANSNEGTVSKIDTQTMEELGRYITRPDSMGSPSRTSVSLTGNVAVANREGGITKIYGNSDDCVDLDDSGVVETSMGSADVLPWDEDECVAWYVPMDYTSQRSVAWTRGEGDPDAAEEITNEKVWVTGDNQASSALDVMLLDGEDGSMEGMVSVQLNAEGSSGWPYRAYGGAVDRESNFWFTSHGENGVIVRVNIDDLSYEQWPKTHWSYGITVDSFGRPWTCEVYVARFDPDTGTWETRGDWDWNYPGLVEIDQGGCMLDGENRLWISVATDFGSNFGVAAIDGETLEVLALYEIPDHAHGISIDFEGYVWGVARADIGPSDGTEAYKINPDNGAFQVFTGLNGAYTYSDMTGFALNSVVAPPVG